jgi:serine phosphatase RsbU (regulator of sigma subunit)
MSLLRDESHAFRQALLKSERLRIHVLLVVVAVALLIRLLRTLAAWNAENASALFWIVLCSAVLLIVELAVLHAIRSAMASERLLTHPVWLINIFLETCFPAFLIAFLSSPSLAPDYRALVNPAFLLYFLLLSLSALRLNPSISVLCGFTSMVTYLFAAGYQGWSLQAALANVSLFAPQKLVVAFAAAILLAAVAAAVVAREFRSQVEAALREAETRRKMEHLQHDLEVARSIQQSLLPRSMPQVSGFEIAAWNKPADQTGGDYYDWQALPDGRVLVALADVTGHGIGPALLAAVCRAYARLSFGQQKNGFLKSMEQLNTAVSADVGEGRFVTFVAAILGPNNSEVELLSAGHAPLFLYWLKNDRFEKMEAQGLPLGISPELFSEQPRTLQFDSGDLLLLATDGFFEWANASEELFGTDRLESCVRASRDKPPAEIISMLYADVLRFAGGTSQKDDLTAIVIKRN